MFQVSFLINSILSSPSLFPLPYFWSHSQFLPSPSPPYLRYLSIHLVRSITHWLICIINIFFNHLFISHTSYQKNITVLFHKIISNNLQSKHYTLSVYIKFTQWYMLYKAQISCYYNYKYIKFHRYFFLKQDAIM